MAENNEPIHVSTDRARAGATPGMTRYVLGIGLVLVIVAFAILLWVW
jgi:hypothetical protein